MQLKIRPLVKWPRPETKERRNDPYRSSWERTLHDLEYEVQRLEAQDAVLQVDVREEDISFAGAIKGGRTPKSPRVAVTFESQLHGVLTYYCDRFFDWRGNVRAIALGLERLRLVEETGIVSRGEQYTGFKALPAGIPLGPPAMTVFEAMELFKLSGLLSRDAFDKAYRVAVKLHHPDRGGGPELWARVQQAAETIEAHLKGVGQ